MQLMISKIDLKANFIYLFRFARKTKSGFRFHQKCSQKMKWKFSNMQGTLMFW